MIPDPLCVLQHAELPVRRVARGGFWCRRVQALQQVLSTLRLTKSLRRARREFSPSTSSPSSSPSSFGSVPRGTSKPLGPLVESHGAYDAGELVATLAAWDWVADLTRDDEPGTLSIRTDGV